MTSLALVLIGLVSGLAEGDLSASTLVVVVAAVSLIGLRFAAAPRPRSAARGVHLAALRRYTHSGVHRDARPRPRLGSPRAGRDHRRVHGRADRGRDRRARRVEHEIRPLAQIFTPFFFALTGASVDLSALGDPSVMVSRWRSPSPASPPRSSAGCSGRAAWVGGPRSLSGSGWSRAARSGSWWRPWGWRAGSSMPTSSAPSSSRSSSRPSPGRSFSNGSFPGRRGEPGGQGTVARQLRGDLTVAERRRASSRALPC